MRHSEHKYTPRQEPVHLGHVGGSNEDHLSQGFVPAFLDGRTGRVYPSRFSNGRPAPVHLPSTLPEELVLRRDTGGRVLALRRSVTPGFLRDGRFYTRAEAMLALGKSESH